MFQFILLAGIRRLYVPSIMRSLTGNFTFSYRDPDKTIQECKDALPPDLLVELKLVLNHHNPTKFVGYFIVYQRLKSYACGISASVVNIIQKVEFP